MKGSVMGWTDERVTTMKKLWLDGLSASQVAKQLGGVTRNAVISKVHRLGLSGRAAPSQPSRPAFHASRSNLAPQPRASRVGSTQRNKPKKFVAPVKDLSDTEGGYVERLEEPGTATMLTLGAHMCKWPIGDPSSEKFTFCGRRVGEDGPYCTGHERLAHQPTLRGKRSASSSELARSLRRYI